MSDKDRLDFLINDTLKVLREAESVNASLSYSGGVDSDLIHYFIQEYNIKINTLYTNSSVENKFNRDRIKEVRKHYNNFIDVSKDTISYKDTVYNIGFPIANKNFSQMCERIRNRGKPTLKNLSDSYRLICGIAPHQNNLKIRTNFRLNIKFWYLASKMPISDRCCNYLKKNPSKKINNKVIIGIMKSDSPKRRNAINKNYNLENKINFFPLREWTKKEVLEFIKINKIPHSKYYEDRQSKVDNIIIKGATNSGCEQCHYGNNVNHYIIKDSKEVKSTKFKILEMEKPKKYKSILKLKHKSGLTFGFVLSIYEDSKEAYYLEESIKIINEWIDELQKLLIEIGIKRENEIYKRLDIFRTPNYTKKQIEASNIRYNLRVTEEEKELVKNYKMRMKDI